MASCEVNLLGCFEVGHVLVVSGKTSEDCKNFKINFTNGGVDFPLTIFVNIRTSEIILNSFVNSQWLGAMKPMEILPFYDGKFKFYILATGEKLHVALNDVNLCSYDHQTSVENIRNIRISGDLETVNQVDHRRIYPSAWPLRQEKSETAAFSAETPIEFFPGVVIVLKMRVTGSSMGSFFITFFDRATNDRQLFHLNPRFANKLVIVNSMNEKLEWHKDEKRFPGFPFKLNQEFKLAIAFTSTCFKVAANGQHLLSYDYRMIQPQMRGYGDQHSIFEMLSGMKLIDQHGMKAFVSYVSFEQMKPECESYENLSYLS